MDISNLKLELLDFSEQSSTKWIIRRIFIGFWLFIYYIYAFTFFVGVAIPESKLFTFLSSTEKIPPLLIMVTFGFIGGVFLITRTYVRTTQKVVNGTKQRQDVPIVWYFSRPFQSALMAIFIYYAFRAGQLVFFSGEGVPGEGQINVYTLSLLAIIAGAFSEQAFEKLHSIASGILNTRTE